LTDDVCIAETVEEDSVPGHVPQPDSENQRTA
jgi:hypothetical protein